MPRIKVEVIDSIKDAAYSAIEYASTLKDSKYADLRVGVSESKTAHSENGTAKGMSEDYGFSFGVRVVAGGMGAWGYYGQPLGVSDLRGKKIEKVFKNSLKTAYNRAVANASGRQRTLCSLNQRGETSLSTALTEVKLAKIDVRQDTFKISFEKDPRAIALNDVLELNTDVSRQMKGISAEVRFAYTGIYTGIIRELFCSSEGARIDQIVPLTQGIIYVVAQQADKAPEMYVDYLGDLKGWEVLEGKNVHKLSFLDFALLRTKETVELAGAEFLKSTNEPVVVVTNPHFNTLLVHEIVGHPTEADRVLKMETAYAGRSWFFRGFDNNQLGKQVASKLVSAYSDPLTEGYGHYKYDAEGVPAKKVSLIENGILKGFMNSRETAAILDQEPNGSMRATDPVLVPLVRMTNTFFANGSRNPEEIIAEVKDGYYIANHKIPSISESRENFRITAQKVYKIENGKLTKLYRSGGITADSKDFLMSIDAVGNDFAIFPIPNCGKGQPMQTMRVGNGGPTLRGKARLTGC
ncbi:MAG TPA: TldD/PmbA family protein [Candidatus Brocadiia bacterium]|nr:TldD/PmbA family protein [Planctomycetota bacterium]MDO8091859.1 TldD/PmbA family protein [Candidatus Brocadiales bacterium]